MKVFSGLIAMSKSLIRLFALMILAFLLAPFESHARTVHFVTDQEKEGGFLIEITKAAFARVGHNVDITYLPWARALFMAMNGQAEALLGSYYNDERAQKMLYSDELARSDMLFFTVTGSGIVFRKLDDLKPYTVGTIIGASYPPEFDAAPFIRKQPATSHVTNIRKLLAGRVDLFVEKKHVVLNTLRTQFPDEASKIEAMPVPLRENRYYNAFSKAYPNHESIAADFNRGLKMIVNDGSYDEIMLRGLHE